MQELSNEIRQKGITSSIPEIEEARSIGFWEAWKVPGVLLYAIAYMCTKASTSGIMFWLPTYLKLDIGFGAVKLMIVTKLKFLIGNSRTFSLRGSRTSYWSNRVRISS